MTSSLGHSAAEQSEVLTFDPQDISVSSKFQNQLIPVTACVWTSNRVLFSSLYTKKFFSKWLGRVYTKTAVFQQKCNIFILQASAFCLQRNPGVIIASLWARREWGPSCVLPWTPWLDAWLPPYLQQRSMVKTVTGWILFFTQNISVDG